ncbi:hypothetical protein [Chitinophaga sp. GbtcB8]|uniref:hypothetical protein n=1 Tax=Chitinophaga sp. GbtcB8 TaxID=2824753 RepID=UPI001C311ADA|nr:hypothetical protein [Chitinophaga sp. GbtcB8]
MYKIALLSLLFSPLLVFSQNSIFPTNGNNVGIGTTTPGHRLTIESTDSTLANIIRLEHNGINGGTVFLGTAPTNYPVLLHRKANILESYTDLHVGAANAGNIFFETGRTSITAPVRMTLDNSGRLGIGTTTPTALLNVSGGNIKLNNPGPYPYGINIDVNFPEGWAREFSISHSGTGKLFGWGVQGYGSSIVYAYIGGNTTADAANATPWMAFKPDGSVGIGTTNPQAKLAVNGDVFAKKIKVTQTGWPDYVFGEDYALPSLAVVEKYINEHKHLPGIPTATAVEKEGLDLGEMNKQLLQKVEELTLYLIELKKENGQQNQRIQQMEQHMAALNKIVK